MSSLVLEMVADPAPPKKQLKNWKSGQYVVNHATNTALETCKACACDYDRNRIDLDERAIAGHEGITDALATLEEQRAYNILSCCC